MILEVPRNHQVLFSIEGPFEPKSPNWLYLITKSNKNIQKHCISREFKQKRGHVTTFLSSEARKVLDSPGQCRIKIY